ncbi:MAG TPA: hypothetical protein VG122_22140 [Gemmata sp.]|jgi:hypothetical protein|nr:hypothetical protein [Gemmata sp.]
MVKVKEPNYGSQTVCRPLRANVPTPRPGWVLTSCPYCGAECWKMDIEPDPLPPDCTFACTDCALKRGQQQREMDAARARREAGATGKM